MGLWAAALLLFNIFKPTYKWTTYGDVTELSSLFSHLILTTCLWGLHPILLKREQEFIDQVTSGEGTGIHRPSYVWGEMPDFPGRCQHSASLKMILKPSLETSCGCRGGVTHGKPVPLKICRWSEAGPRSWVKRGPSSTFHTCRLSFWTRMSRTGAFLHIPTGLASAFTWPLLPPLPGLSFGCIHQQLPASNLWLRFPATDTPDVSP